VAPHYFFFFFFFFFFFARTSPHCTSAFALVHAHYHGFWFHRHYLRAAFAPLPHLGPSHCTFTLRFADRILRVLVRAPRVCRTLRFTPTHAVVWTLPAAAGFFNNRSAPRTLVPLSFLVYTQVRVLRLRTLVLRTCCAPLGRAPGTRCTPRLRSRSTAHAHAPLTAVRSPRSAFLLVCLDVTTLTRTLCYSPHFHTTSHGRLLLPHAAVARLLSFRTHAADQRSHFKPTSSRTLFCCTADSWFAPHNAFHSSGLDKVPQVRVFIRIPRFWDSYSYCTTYHRFPPLCRRLVVPRSALPGLCCHILSPHTGH